jgi:hemolysin activation/secretion protein
MTRVLWDVLSNARMSLNSQARLYSALGLRALRGATAVVWGQRGAVSLRHAAFFVAVALLAAPGAVPAQECEVGEPDCASGGPCPLRNLPYEEFIATPPTDRGGRDIPPVVDRPFDPEAGDRILVRGFVVEGVTPNPDAGVTPQTAQAAADAAFARETGGKPDARMTVGHMVLVADAVTTFYRSKGYLVAKAFLPVQTVGPDSLVKIQVMEGKVSDVVVEGAKEYSVSVLRKPSVPLVGDIPQRDDVESALLYTQDYPGIRLFGSFRPGATTGETKLVLQVLDEDSFGFQFGGDNYGNEFTGLYRARFDGAWKNPIGWGDQLDVTLLQAVTPANTTFGSISYRVPVGPRGFSAFVGANNNQFSVSGPLEILNLEGTINILEIGVDWRFLRYRFQNARASLSLANKKSELTAVSGQLPISDDDYNVLIASFDMDGIDTRFKGVDQPLVKVRQGLGGDLGTRSGLDPNFTIYELRYVRVQALGDTQTGVLRLRLQQTDKALSPLEQFALAGPDAVRAYPVGQALRDTGHFASLEYRVQAPGFARRPGPFGRSWGDLLQLLLFYDYAYGEDAEAGGVEVDLSGYGAGFQFGVPGTFNMLVQGAAPISSAIANDGDDFRLYGEFQIKF